MKCPVDALLRKGCYLLLSGARLLHPVLVRQMSATIRNAVVADSSKNGEEADSFPLNPTLFV